MNDNFIKICSYFNQQIDISTNLHLEKDPYINKYANLLIQTYNHNNDIFMFDEWSWLNEITQKSITYKEYLEITKLDDYELILELDIKDTKAINRLKYKLRTIRKKALLNGGQYEKNN